ncbi:MAG: hypothetical protein ACLR0U_12730 [Enterocloster clostridioformis]
MESFFNEQKMLGSSLKAGAVCGMLMVMNPFTSWLQSVLDSQCRYIRCHYYSGERQH